MTAKSTESCSANASNFCLSQTSMRKDIWTVFPLVAGFRGLAMRGSLDSLDLLVKH